jgi:hypothetical protein
MDAEHPRNDAYVMSQDRPSLGQRILHTLNSTLEAEPSSNVGQRVLRHVRLILTICIFSSESCFADTMYPYEVCHAPTLSSQDPLDNNSCTYLNSAMRSPRHFLRNPSTTSFVFVALFYGMQTSSQYDLKRVDKFQRAFLMVGLVVELYAGVRTGVLGEERFIASRLGYYVMISLLASACEHCLWWMCSGTNKVDEERVVVTGEKGKTEEV